MAFEVGQRAIDRFSGEGYKPKAEAQGAIAVVKRDAPAADVDDQTATTF